MRSTFSRSFFPFVMILLAALILVGFFFLNLAQRFLQKQMEEDLKNDCAAISQLAGAYLTEDSLGSRDFQVNLSVAAKVSQSDAVICDENGTLLICSDAPLGCVHQGLCITDETFFTAVSLT